MLRVEALLVDRLKALEKFVFACFVRPNYHLALIPGVDDQPLIWQTALHQLLILGCFARPGFRKLVSGAATPNGIGFWWLAIQLWKDVFGLGGVATWIAIGCELNRLVFVDEGIDPAQAAYA